ncbi:uncharacterized protein RJT21DRAFT_111824 [Scheffersomyces amazonensis]|uniref:uncharacterized protein n=1 Tax=Scheffersomyces amazonensis TaxID=1078765 RepID=UPI00315C695F
MATLQSPFSFSFPNTYNNNRTNSSTTSSNNSFKPTSSMSNEGYLPTPNSSRARNNISSTEEIPPNSQLPISNDSYDKLIDKLNIMKSKLNKLDSNTIVGELKQLIEESYQLIANSDTLSHINDDNGNDNIIATPTNSYRRQNNSDAGSNYYTPPPSSTNDDIMFQTPINKIINNENLFKRQLYSEEDDLIDWHSDLNHFQYISNNKVINNSYVTGSSNLEHEFEINFELN